MNIRTNLTAILALLLLVSCSGPQGYVRTGVIVMNKFGLFAEGPQWDSTKAELRAAKPETMDEAQALVRSAVKVAGGKHSFLYYADDVKSDRAAEWEMPAVSITDDGIAQIKLPAFSGDKESAEEYARTVLQAVPDDITGAIIDLRGNTGGNMYPMIASVHRFISSGDDMLRFRSRKRTNYIVLSFVVRSVGVEQMAHIDCPVALLTDGDTASSGEATLICFRGQENARSFGSPTAGYASANSSFPMPDGSMLVLTTGCDVARTGEVFCDDPIEPDAITESPIEEALAWIRQGLQERAGN